MKVLVTGGAGFIGSFLCEKLLENRHDVICLDNLSTGKKSNINHLLKNPKFKFLEHDVTEPIDLKVDMIFHLASPASPVDYQRLPIETSMANSLGTFNMLNLAKKNRARFLLASTSEVYGNPLQHPQKEDYWGNVNPVGIRSCYDESKRFAETLTTSFHSKYGLDVRITRIFNTFGPKMRSNDGRAIPNFITQSLTKKPITVYGDGKQTRSFCYVSDMVEGLIKMMFTENLSGSVFNLGNPEERNVVDVAEIIKKLIKSNSEIIFNPLPQDDPIRRKPNIDKAKKILNWQPKVDFITGLKKTIEWFKGELKE